METVSLYDKYHSLHNKKYMYNLITNLIQKEKSVDMSENFTYNQFFETNFINTFKDVETEDLKDLNKHLLDTQIDYYNQFISKQRALIKTDEKEDETNKEDEINKEEEEEDDEDKHSIIHSLKRIINLQNSSRFNYRISNELKGKTCQVEKVILPIEDTTLFMCPVVILCLDTKYIDLHLRGTMKLGHRDYGLYTPFYETTFQLNSDKLRIQFKNQLLNLKKGCDVYKITSYEENMITLTYDKGEFLEGDYIRICNFEGIELDDDSCLKDQYKIKGVHDNKLIITNDVIKEGLYVMNLSVQHSIHLSYN